MAQVLFFVDMKLPRGVEPKAQITEIPGGGGSTVKPSGMENLGVENLHEGYGYFREPLIECCKCFIV